MLKMTCSQEDSKDITVCFSLHTDEDGEVNLAVSINGNMPNDLLYFHLEDGKIQAVTYTGYDAEVQDLFVMNGRGISLA